MGDYKSINSNSGDILGSLAQYAPKALQAFTSLAPDTAKQQLAADKAVAPGYNQLYNQGQLSSANTEAQIAAGPGQSLVNSALKSQQTLDPEYYKSRSLLNNSLSKYLTSYDPSKLTPTEESQISRGINATTGPVTSSNMNTIRNAQTFGNAATNRWQNFGNAITQASGAIPTMKSGLDGFSIATQRGSNPMGTTGGDTGKTALGANTGFASNALSTIGSAANTSIGKDKTIPDQINSAVGSY